MRFGALVLCIKPTLSLPLLKIPIFHDEMNFPKPSSSERAERAERDADASDERVAVTAESVDGLEKALRAAEEALRAASEQAEGGLREASERAERAEQHAVTAEA